MSRSLFARRAVRVLVVACAMLGSVGAQAASAAIQVDDDKAQCPKAGFRTISRALAFAPAGATVVVCPGTYPEALQIATPGVRVVGLTGRAADVIVKAPSSVPTTMVDVSGPATRLEAVTVHALGRNSPGLDENGFPIPVDGFVGVSIHDGIGPVSDAVILDNVTVRHVGDRGIGVVIGDPNGPPSPGGRAIVRNSRVVDVGDGIEVNPRSVATIQDNVIRSVRDPFPGAESGIFVEGAAVRLLRNDISGFTQVPNFDFCDFCFSAGIFFRGSGRIGGLPTGNGNNIHDNAAGLIMASAHGVTVSNNAVHDNLATGITVDATSSLNQFLHNLATNNATVLGLDCLDRSTGSATAGTANTWLDNIGATAFPPDICAPPAP